MKSNAIENLDIMIGQDIMKILPISSINSKTLLVHKHLDTMYKI